MRVKFRKTKTIQKKLGFRFPNKFSTNTSFIFPQTKLTADRWLNFDNDLKFWVLETA